MRAITALGLVLVLGTACAKKPVAKAAAPPPAAPAAEPAPVERAAPPPTNAPDSAKPLPKKKGDPDSGGE